MDKIKQNRLLSFIVLGIIYAAATVIGVMTYNLTSGEWWLRLLIADTVSTIFTFIGSLIFKNASVYDPYWSVQPIVILGAFIIGRKITLVKILTVTAVFYWGIRLTANWAYTFGGLNHQDWRYTMLSEKTGIFYPVINFVGIHMVPTIVVYFVTLPACYVLISEDKVFSKLLAVIGFCISVGAATLQGIADITMHKYRKNRNAPFIRNGVWKYSRHPNYLGEILMWWGIAILSIGALGFSWIYILGAVLNTLLFLCVSIPLAEGRQSTKEGYMEYKKETRMLLPVPK